MIERLVDCLAPGGTLLVTTPHGHWESNEHLQEFTLERFAALLASGGAERSRAGYLRDGAGRRRWLVGEVEAPLEPPADDGFTNRSAVAELRRSRGGSR